MIDIKIKDRGTIVIYMNNKVAYVSGELTMDPAFYADLNGLKYWSEPVPNIEITSDEKQLILNFVKKDAKKKGLIFLLFLSNNDCICLDVNICY